MKVIRTTAGWMAAAAVLAVSGIASAQAANTASHVDFDDQLIQGQVNKGAVHLIERKDSDFGSLVKIRKSYRKEILAGAFDEPAASVPAAMVASIPVSIAPAQDTEPLAKADPVVRQAPVAAKPASPKAAAKNVKSSKSIPSSAKIGGSRAISRR